MTSTPASAVTSMTWPRLMCRQRIGRPLALDLEEPHRSHFEIDADRIVYSAAFRRLANKQQVHARGASSYVRSRLTHSLEVSRVGRSLGTWVGRELAAAGLLGGSVLPQDLGHVVLAAALAHDVGNPPFGHQGEEIISAWMRDTPLARELLRDLPEAQRRELTRLEGNAQGFRVLTRLQGWRPEGGGLQLTAATLGAFLKYPFGCDAMTPKGKFGFYQEDHAAFEAIADLCGLLPGARHPLAHLVEAADDIAYSVVDLEDAVKTGFLSFAEAEAVLAPLAQFDPVEYEDIEGLDHRIIALRSRAIARLIRASADAFKQHYQEIITGRFPGDLLRASSCAHEIETIRVLSRERIYAHANRVDNDLRALRALHTLLQVWCELFLEREMAGPEGRLSPRAVITLRLFPDIDQVPYERAGWLRCVLDYVAGCTDDYAIQQAEVVA